MHVIFGLFALLAFINDAAGWGWFWLILTIVSLVRNYPRYYR